MALNVKQQIKKQGFETSQRKKKTERRYNYGFPEWLQTQRPRGPFAVTQALLSSLITTLFILCFICIVFLFI